MVAGVVIAGLVFFLSSAIFRKKILQWGRVIGVTISAFLRGRAGAKVENSLEQGMAYFTGGIILGARRNNTKEKNEDLAKFYENLARELRKEGKIEL